MNPFPETAGAWFSALDAVSVITLVIILMGIIIFLISLAIFQSSLAKRYRVRKRLRMTGIIRSFLADPESIHTLPFIRRNRNLFLHEYLRLREMIELPENIERKIHVIFGELKIDRYYRLGLHSLFSIKRKRSALMLGAISGKLVYESLTRAFIREKKYHVRLYIAYSLSRIKDPRSIEIILRSIHGAPPLYRDRIYGILFSFGADLVNYLRQFLDNPPDEYLKLIWTVAAAFPDQDLHHFLLKMSGSDDPNLYLPAVRALQSLYYLDLDNPFYLRHTDPLVRQQAIVSLGRHDSWDKVNEIIPFIESTETRTEAVHAINAIVQQNPEYLKKILDLFIEEKSLPRLQGLAEIISDRIDYLIMKLKGDRENKITRVIYMIALLGYTGGIVTFLNRNEDESIENRIISILGEVILERFDLEVELALTLNEKITEKMGLTKPPLLPAKPREEKVRLLYLYLFLAIGILIFPVLFTAAFWNDLATISSGNFFSRYFYVFNYYFAFYAFAINGIYLGLMVLSLGEKKRQKSLWALKYSSMLFMKNLLPSVSIIAPAYGEEASIIPSVTSLLNLRYPDFEVIVVNDGSKDATLEKVVKHFNLEKTDFLYEKTLQTAKVRGIYYNPDYPKLKVIDKVNGGKADSLNAGINLARGEYFCGIDADSLLENDALLKIASTFLDTDNTVIAAGGNIIPVNGCGVDRGAITKVSLPEKFWARLQVLEYFRSFLSGRLGWSSIKSLLIISGAFGVFRKDDVLSAHGYMTSREKFGKDTVGEDMELVVRISRYQRDLNKKIAINYAYNANCWTEVPEDWNILYRQRDRWHRGLLDIMTFHIGMLFNPRYGRIGLIALPYFLVFEIIGPWIELQGYLIFFTAIAMGFLDSFIILLLFTATVLFGILLSIMSVYIVETGIGIFRIRDLFRVLFMAFLENFGLRQILSMMRVSAYINALKQKSGWGEMIRKGFNRDAAKTGS